MKTYNVLTSLLSARNRWINLKLLLLFTEAYIDHAIAYEMESKNPRILDLEGTLELIVSYYVNKRFIEEIRLYSNMGKTKEVTV